MINVLIVGANGKMGKKIKENSINFPEIKPVCGVDITENLSDKDFPVYNDFNKVSEKIDVVIDFSSPLSLDNVLKYATENKVNAVLCPTGYTEDDMKKITEASKNIAIFKSANMSLGVNVLIDLVKKAAAGLYGFDVEIIEKHHNQKKDAPSGTALMLADGVRKVNPEKFYTYGREGIVGARNKNEIGIHAIRGGNIVGEHQVIFAGESETITLTHQATDRAIFAVGALNAAKYLSTKVNGLYDMSDMLNGK